MERFFQAAAAALIAAILGLALSKQGRDWTLILTTLVSCMVLAVAAAYLEPILDFVQRLQGDSRLDGDMLAVILKAVGIGLVAECAGLICQDAGNAALGKGIQILSSIVILWLALPLMEGLLELVQKIVGGV